MKSALVFLAVIAVILLLCFLLGARENEKARRTLRRHLSDGFGRSPDKKIDPQRAAHISAYYLRHPPADGVDDITWNDLEMDAVYARMDSTLSDAGEEILYALLRSPLRTPHGKEGNDGNEDKPGETRPGPSLTIPQKEIRYFADPGNEKTRLDLQISLARLGHAGRLSIYDYLDRLDAVKAEPAGRQLTAVLLPALSLAILFLSVPAGVICLIVSLAFNMVTYYRRRGEIAPYLTVFSWLLRMLRCADEMTSAVCPAIDAEQGQLRAALPSLARFRRGSGILLSGSVVSGGNPVDLLLDYLRIFFHIDLMKFNGMLAQARIHAAEFDRVFTALGRIDAAIALASFRRSLPFTCEPQLRASAEKIPGDSSGPSLSVRELYHPLLADPVPNSIMAKRPVLLTGSNASGKSTFLKAVALCALFAQTIGFCPASSYQGNCFRIRTSMALRDSIAGHESYFMAEIRSLKRIAVLTRDGGAPVLCCIDEVLRGTNTVERIAASTEILRSFAASGVLCFAATHDIELTALLSEQFDNVHFEERLEGGDVVFPYRLCTGRAHSCNAILLLDRSGFDRGITGRAKRRAALFEQTGKWLEPGPSVDDEGDEGDDDETRSTLPALFEEAKTTLAGAG